MKRVLLTVLLTMLGLCGCAGIRGVPGTRPGTTAFTTGARLKPGRYGHAAVTVGDDIYIVGGSAPREYLGKVEKFDASRNRLETVTDKLDPRRYLTAEVWDGMIYAAGGYKRRDGALPVLERVDPKDGTVTRLSPMNKARYFPCSTVRDGRIYVIGGSPRRRGVTGAVEIYDIASDTWSDGKPMPTPRQTDCVLRDGNIYTVGGFNGKEAVRNFEVYDIGKDEWEKLPDLPFPLSAHHAVVAGDVLYTFGDYADLDKVCSYDFNTGEWRELPGTGYRPARHNASVVAGDAVYVIGGNVASAGSHLDGIQAVKIKGLEKAGALPVSRAGEEELSTEEEILAELKEIRKLLKQLAASREGTRSRRAVARLTPSTGKSTGLAGKEAIEDITLPADPTKMDVEEYVSALEEATRMQRMYSSRDPQVEKLAALGPDHVAVLLEEMKQPHSRLKFYLDRVLKKIVGDGQKELILGNLLEIPSLIGVVVDKEWVEDARPILIEGLRNDPEELPITWIKVVAQFRDPEATELLKNYLVSGGNKEMTYDSIKDIPGIDLGATVDKMWERALRNGEAERNKAAPVALRFGKKKALDTVFANLKSDKRRVVQKAQRLITRHTNACVSDDGTRVVFPGDDKLVLWYEQNGDKLAYNEESERFHVPAPGGAGEAKASGLLSVDANNLAHGDAVPDFTVGTLDGKTITLSDFKGKVVLLDFWATWCGPCRKETPGLREAYRKYHDRGFEIIGINRDRKLGRLKDYIEKEGITWPQVTDGERGRGGLAAVYNISSIPKPILLDRDLKVYDPSARGKGLDSALEELFPK